MTIDDYAAWAATVANVTVAPDTAKLSYLGLAAESGEVADHIKKLPRDGKLDKSAMIEELGDVIYYWACLCAAAGEKPSELLAKSREKIAGRVAARD
jgi:NTP pyrophosphatase (non-canonical NTP hydrolase)